MPNAPVHAPTALIELGAKWRAEARDVRDRYGDDRLARICEVHALELERAATALGAEELTLDEAALASGYSTSHLRALIACGELRNAGRRGRPRLIRAELPRKRGYEPPVPSTGLARARPGPRPIAKR